MEEVEKENMRNLLSTLSEGSPPPENQLNLNFIQDDNDVPKEKAKKSRNLLTNIS